ncbi:hypothetical protein Sya03_26620 [Spirilliplanes yamanashiensis]|uniref:Uncharacterized protein n=1 Tax=Spirilliplanes yamanashiensis TaxID=42233 RepID=A0A8J3Y8S8_9ACTN|nr:hypothetical protein [Spirilliplanes yamanashiensis]GIJ03310.1 hypothetical protein Sya03_26620 [Spirilliplanes yamanashiensis]
MQKAAEESAARPELREQAWRFQSEETAAQPGFRRWWADRVPQVIMAAPTSRIRSGYRSSQATASSGIRCVMS